jgi:GDP-fucose transporter C1
MFQCAVSVVICWVLGNFAQGAPQGSLLAQFQPFTYKPHIAKGLLQLSVVFVGMITFNNLSLKYVEVSFYNVARSLTIVFNVVFTFVMLGERTSQAVLACLATVIVGFFVGAKGEVHFSLIGTLYGVTSSVFVSLNSIYTKKAMSLIDGNTWTLSAYNNMNAMLLFVPIILVNGEIAIISENWALLFSPYFWTIMILGGVFGFLINVVTIMQIKATSPLTHNISGTAKACVQTVLALMIWKNPTSFENLLGVALVLFGSMAYGYIRNKEMEADGERKAREKAALEEAKRLQALEAAREPGLDGEGDDVLADQTMAEKGSLLDKGRRSNF